ncbi:MAG: hypothetical protein PF961_13980, partial [Planctomycetota bacterium]|nr:hypothetical protein [Planctomycetota bacterium]
PHGPPIRCIRRIEAITERRWLACAVLDEDHPGLDAGRLRSAYLIEIAAQAAAACAGLTNSAGTESQAGMLVGLGNWTFNHGANHNDLTGQELTVTLDTGPRLGDLHAYEASIYYGDQQLGAGSLRVMLKAPPDSI